jgi:hypothetical protein
MTSVAARYQVSGSYLTQVCTRLNVPRPSRGHWAQVAVGKTAERPPLPEPRPGDELEWARDGAHARCYRPLPKAPAANAPRVVRSRGELPPRHDLIIGARELFLDTRRSDDGYLRPMKHALVDLYVSKESLQRALDVANELFLELERHGYRVALAPAGLALRRPAIDEREVPGPARYQSSWSPALPTVSYVGTVAIGLTIFELSEHVEVQYVKDKYVRVAPPVPGKRGRPRSVGVWTHKRDMASGRLCLRAFSPYADTEWQKLWKEEGETRLLSLIPRIIQDLASTAASIAKMAEDAERRAEVRAREHEIQMQEWHREQLERQRLEAARMREQQYRQSRDQLVQMVEAWQVARWANKFLTEVEKRSATDESSDARLLRDRVQEARRVLGTMDVVERFRAWRSPEEQ